MMHSSSSISNHRTHTPAAKTALKSLCVILEKDFFREAGIFYILSANSARNSRSGIIFLMPTALFRGYLSCEKEFTASGCCCTITVYRAFTAGVFIRWPCGPSVIR